MLIRLAAENDLGDVLELLKEMDHEAGLDLSEAMTIWRKMKEYPFYKVFVVEDKGAIVGTCSLIIIENLGHNGAKLAVAESMIVSQNCRGCGIGSQLIYYILDKAKEENCYKLMLSSNKKRLPAHKFYEQLGFQQHGISFMVELQD